MKMELNFDSTDGSVSISDSQDVDTYMRILVVLYSFQPGCSDWRKHHQQQVETTQSQTLYDF